MTNLTDEKILEFIHAGEGWFWDDDPNKTYQAAPSALEFKRIFPFVARFKHGGCLGFKNFSLTKPQVYEDKRWYSATIKNPKTVLPKELKRVFLYNDGIFETLSIRARDVAEFKEHQLTNIRPIPEELWEDE